MKDSNSTLNLFALKSFVSVLPETERETALKIVGGGDPPDDPCDPYFGKELNIRDCDAWDCIDYMLDFAEGEGFDDPYFEIDDEGNIIHWGDGRPEGENYYNSDDFDRWKEEYPCPVAANY